MAPTKGIFKKNNEKNFRHDCFYLLAWGFSLPIVISVLVQTVYMCKRISINIFLEIPFSKNPHHRETSQPICFAVLTERYFRTDFRPLLTVMSYSQRTYKSNYSDLYFSEYVSNSEASIKSFSQNKHLPNHR